MKQVKFFLVALMAVVMGMSVTSCMNGDDNTQVNDLPVLGKVKDSFLGLTFTSLDGFTFKSKNTVEGTTNFMTGDFIVATCSYDTEVDIDYTTNTINATSDLLKKSRVMLYIVRQKQKMKESILLMFQIEVS
mgnify:FL=1